MIRRIDPVGRAAFGLLCIGGMTLCAVPVLILVGIVGGVSTAIGGDSSRALGVWLVSWGGAAFATFLLLAILYVFWPLASDWITEWQGYVMGVIIGALGLGLMALTVFVTDWPLAIELVIPFVATFIVGFAIPGWFLGIGPELRTLDHRRERVVRRPP